MYPFNLRGEKLFVRRAQLFENSGWGAEQVGEITEEEIVIEGIVMAKRQRGAHTQEPYVYIDKNKNARYPEDALVKPSGRGFWLNQADY